MATTPHEQYADLERFLRRFKAAAYCVILAGGDIDADLIAAVDQVRAEMMAPDSGDRSQVLRARGLIREYRGQTVGEPMDADRAA